MLVEICIFFMQEEETQVSTLECKNHFITIYNLCVVCDKVE